MSLGLANEAVAPGTLMDRALALAASFGAMDGTTLRCAKNLFYQLADMPLREGMRAGVAASLQQ